MSTGFITLHRKITEWEWYEDANTFRLFIHLLLNANHKSKNWRGNTILKGQLITGRDSLASSLGLTPQQIRTSLNKLKSTNEITTEPTNRFTLITLVKYSSYQDKVGASNQLDNQQTTNKQPTSNQQVTTTNNVNNVNNIKNIKGIAKKAKAFIRPSVKEVSAYILHKHFSVDADSFVNHYESNGWKVGRNSMKNWQATVCQWESRSKKEGKNEKFKPIDNQDRDYGETNEGFLANFS